MLAVGVLVPYLLTCFAIELTPGPNMAYLAILSIERGRAAGLVAVLGVALGLGVLGLLADPKAPTPVMLWSGLR